MSEGSLTSRGLTAAAIALMCLCVYLGLHCQRLQSELQATQKNLETVRESHDKAFESSRIHMAAEAKLRAQVYAMTQQQLSTNP